MQMKSNDSTSMISAALVALVAGASMLLAQWPEHRTEGPRTGSSDLDLKAPAPKAPDGSHRVRRHLEDHQSLAAEIGESHGVPAATWKR